jgi:3-oxoadipate enol-lactonase
LTALAYEVFGPEGAPPLLMGASLGTAMAMWDRQLPLATQFRLIRFDHRGHGASPVPPGPYEIADLGRDALELMDRLGIERASYCGLSIGGMVGMWLGASAPERVERLVLNCTAAYMPPASRWRERAERVLAEASTEPIADSVVERWLTPAFATEHPDVREWLRAMLVVSPADGYAACCGAIERMDLRGQLSQITAPTLVISGANDLATPVEMQELIAGAIPGARHEVVGPGAHVAVVEQSERVNQLIQEHLS